MKVRLVAHTPFETYSSQWTDATKEQIEEYEGFLKTMCDGGTYIELKTELFGTVYIPKGMIQKSIFRIVTKP